MPTQLKRYMLAAASVLLVGWAPASQRLSYDREVFLAGTCLSPAFSGCHAAGQPGRISRSASEALLDAGQEPRLPLDMAGMLDMGPELSGGAGSPSPAAP